MNEMDLVLENESLRLRLQGAEEALRAIQTGAVDAFVVRDADGREGVYALKTSDQSFRFLVEEMQEGAAVLSEDGTIVYANRRFAEMLRLPLHDVISRPFISFVAHGSAHDVDAELLLNQARRGKAIGELVLRARDSDGQGQGVAAYLSAGVFEMDGRPAIGLVATDLTDRKHAEKMAADSRAKDHFLAMLSHELRTPLTPVLMAARLMQADHTLSTEHRDMLAMIRRNVEMEARLIDDLLDITRITRGKVELRHEITDVHAVIRAAVEICSADIAFKQLTIDLDLGAESAHVWADRTRLQQVCWNLMNNAVKFTMPNGRISCRTSNDGNSGQVRIEFSDTGVGIDPEALPRLFEAFEQGSRTVTRQFGGLGLGLSISKALIDLHGGTLTARSDGINQGATFTLELTTVPKVAPAISARASLMVNMPCSGADSRATTSSSRPSSSRCRILLVDDHADTLRSLRRILLSFGYSVEVASSVSGALQQAAAADFDVLVSDIGLPDGTGMDIIRELRTRSEIPGVAVSGFGMEEDIRRSREAGFTEHLIKPIDLDALKLAIERIIGGSADASTPGDRAVPRSVPSQ